jgi:hypothetical protein
MASRRLDLIVDVGRGVLLASFEGTASTQLPPLVLGDTIPLSVRAVKLRSNVSGAQPWNDVDLSGLLVRTAIGVPSLDNPLSLATLSDPLPSADITVDVLQQGSTDTQAEITSITLDPVPYDGSYTLSIGSDQTGQIPYDATAQEIQAELENLTGIGAGNVIVTGEFPRYIITTDKSLGNLSDITPGVSGLIVPIGKQGKISLATEELEAWLGNESPKQATFEIEFFNELTDEAWTPVQAPVTVRKQVIPNAPLEPVELPEWMRAALDLELAPDDGVEGVNQVISTSFSNSAAVIENGTVVFGVSAAVLGSQVTGEFTVATTMSASDVGAAFRAALSELSAITTAFNVGGTGAQVTLTRKVAAANDATAVILMENGTGEIEAYPTSSITVEGVAAVTGTLASRLGQLAIVPPTSVFVCTRVNPVRWLGPLSYT